MTNKELWTEMDRKKARMDKVTGYIVLALVCAVVGTCSVHYARKSDQAVERYQRALEVGR